MKSIVIPLFILLLVIIIGVLLLQDAHDEEERWGTPTLATTTPSATLRPAEGWWDALPTAPIIPTFPPFSPTPTP